MFETIDWAVMAAFVVAFVGSNMAILRLVGAHKRPVRRHLQSVNQELEQAFGHVQDDSETYKKIFNDGP